MAPLVSKGGTGTTFVRRLKSAERRKCTTTAGSEERTVAATGRWSPYENRDWWVIQESAVFQGAESEDPEEWEEAEGEEGGMVAGKRRKAAVKEEE